MNLVLRISKIYYPIIILWLAPTFSFSQTMQTGIYEVIYNTDTTFIHQNIPKLIPKQSNNNDLQFAYDYKYSNFIDSTYQIKYAIVISSENPKKKGHRDLQMVWLNKTIPKYYGVSYSDNFVRKYFYYNTSVFNNEIMNPWNYERNYIDENGFLKYYNPKNEYQNEYVSKYDGTVFFGNKNYFFLKSNYYNPVVNKVEVDSSSYYNNPMVGSGYTKGKQFVTINQPILTAKLKTLKNYKSFLSIQRDSIKFYDADAKIIKTLNSGDFISLINETDEWYIGEHISAGGDVTAGKIFIEDMYVGKIKSITQNGLLIKAKYGLFEENQGWNQLGNISGIKTYDKNRLIQVIKNPGFVSDTLSVLDFADVNFDGYKDLVLYSHDGGAGPNYGNNYFIFNPKTKQFIFNEAMSDLSQPEINFKTKTIHAGWRNGAANHGAETYKWINGKFTMVEYYETNYNSNDKLEVIHTFLIDGKMRPKPRLKKGKKLTTKKK